MLKRQLRVQYRKKRDLLSSSLVDEYSIKIANSVVQLPIWHFFYFHIFLSIAKQREVDTSFILTVLQGKDKNIVVPKISATQTLQHFLLLDSTALKSNKYGIPEPVDGIAIQERVLDVVFIPLLAFDQQGHRVGYGQGYYDQFLKKCRPDVLKIGLSFFEPEPQISDINNNDIPLDYCVTPERVYSF